MGGESRIVPPADPGSMPEIGVMWGRGKGNNIVSVFLSDLIRRVLLEILGGLLITNIYLQDMFLEKQKPTPCLSLGPPLSLSLSHFASTWHRYTLNICSVIRGDI